MEYLALVVEKKKWDVMKDLNIHKRRFREFDGWRLVKEYTKLGIGPVVIKTVCFCFIRRESLRAIYP